MKIRKFSLLVLIVLFSVVYTGCSDKVSNNSVQKGATWIKEDTRIDERRTQVDYSVYSQKIYDFIISLKTKNAVEISTALTKWAVRGNPGTDYWISSIAADKSDPSLPETVLLSFSSSYASSDGYAIFWWENDNLKYNVFKAEGSSAKEFPDNLTVISARINRSDNGSIEMAAVFDAFGYGNGGWSMPWPVFKLLRQEKEDWKIVWSSPWSGAPQEDWQNNHGIIKFNDQSISEFTLEGDSLSYTDGKEKILSQTKSGRMRYFSQIWSREGDKYILKKSEFVHTAFTTLIEFIYSISKGDDKTALKYVKDKSLINKAKELGLVQKSLDGNWPVAYPQGMDDNEQMRLATQLTIVLDQEKQIRIKVDFIKKDNQFLISGLNK